MENELSASTHFPVEPNVTRSTQIFVINHLPCKLFVRLLFRFKVISTTSCKSELGHISQWLSSIFKPLSSLQNWDHSEQLKVNKILRGNLNWISSLHSVLKFAYIFEFNLIDSATTNALTIIKAKLYGSQLFLICCSKFANRLNFCKEISEILCRNIYYIMSLSGSWNTVTNLQL